MGGMGSGRYWHYGAKGTSENYDKIDVRRWHRDGLLAPGSTFRCLWRRNGEVVSSIYVSAEPDRVILTYFRRKRGDVWEEECYPVWLDWTPCNFGGQRPWFRCPASECGRRVAILYGGRIFACRHCYELAYPSQRETASDRAIRRADKIRQRLGWVRGIANFKGSKPKGMHWRTFERLEQEHDACVVGAITKWSGNHFPEAQNLGALIDRDDIGSGA